MTHGIYTPCVSDVGPAVSEPRDFENVDTAWIDAWTDIRPVLPVVTKQTTDYWHFMVRQEVDPAVEESRFLGEPCHSQHYKWDHHHPLGKPTHHISFNVTPKTTKLHLIACSHKSVSYVTNNKRLYSTFCTVEANYWQTRSIARPLCNSRATCYSFMLFMYRTTRQLCKYVWLPVRCSSNTLCPSM